MFCSNRMSKDLLDIWCMAIQVERKTDDLMKSEFDSQLISRCLQKNHYIKFFFHILNKEG